MASMNQTLEFTSKLPPALKVTINGISDNKWVMYNRAVGVVTELKLGSAIFNAVGEDGITYLSTPVNPQELVLATYAQIPDIRKPTQDKAYELGYALDTH